MTNTPSPTSTKERAWVWFSTDESIAKGQISLLACAEIPVAMAFFWWISQISPWPWLTLIALMAAPMLLLRSPASIELGLEWFSEYLAAFDRKNGQITQKKDFFIIFISLSIVFLFAHTIVNHYFIELNDWGFGVGISLLVTLLFVLLVALTVACGTLFLFLMVARWLNNFFRISGMGVLVLAIVGVCIRASLIRIIVSCKYIGTGITYFSQNFKENIFIIDITHPPELMPKVHELDPIFSVRALWRARKSGVGEELFALTLAFLIYIPTLLYRWNIKASSMIWGLLAFVLRPVVWEEKNDDEMRERTSAITTKVAQRIGGGLGVGLLIWLNFPNKINEVAMKALGNDWLGLFGFPWTAPPVGLRYVVSMLLAGALLAHCAFSYYLRSSHSKALEGATDYKPENKVRIHQLAEPVWFSFRLTFALAVLTVWSYALAYGLDQWPEVTQGLVWGWLRGWV